MMMQTADSRHLDHLPPLRRLHRSWHGTIVVEGSMWTYVMIILKVGFENLRQLSFMEYDHSIQAFSPMALG